MQELNQQQRMFQIVRQMKEIPELPSEAPKDVQPLERVEFPESGGVLTYMGGMPYPYKGFPFFEFVDKIDVMKKISRAVLSGLYHQLKNKKYLLITLLPAVWLLKPIFRTYLFVVYRLVDRFKLKPKMYSDAVREIYRAFTGTSDFQNMFRDALCMTLEMDNAYRYRFQDIIVNLDKDALQRNGRKELLRLMGILSERERTQDIRDTWFLVKLAISVYLFVDRDFKNLLVNALLDLDLEKVALAIEDKTYAAGRKDYLFGFMLKPDPEGAYCVKFSKLREEFTEKKQKIQEESTKVHEELFKKQEVEQKLIAAKISDEEAARINAEIGEKAALLLAQRDEAIQNLVTSHQAEEKELVMSYLTPEQRDLADIHAKETKKLDEEWTSQLTKEEDNYKITCQQLLSMVK